MSDAATPQPTVALACPSCAAVYNVPASKIGPKGRKMKCAQCGHLWVGGSEERGTRNEEGERKKEGGRIEEGTAASEIKVPTSPSVVEEVISPTEVLAPPALEAMALPAWHAWVLGDQKWLGLAFALAVLGLIAGAVGLWQTLEPPNSSHEAASVLSHAATPKAARMVSAPLGVVLHDVEGVAEETPAGVVLTINGKIANTGAADATLPTLRASILDDAGEAQDFWPVKLIAPMLPTQMEMPFAVSFTNPPGVGFRLDWVERHEEEPVLPSLSETEHKISEIEHEAAPAAPAHDTHH